MLPNNGVKMKGKSQSMRWESCICRLLTHWKLEWPKDKWGEERDAYTYIYINWNIAFINCSITHLAISWEIGKKKGRRRGKNLRNPKKPRAHLTGMESMKTSSLMEDIWRFHLLIFLSENMAPWRRAHWLIKVTHQANSRNSKRPQISRVLPWASSLFLLAVSIPGIHHSLWMSLKSK